MRIRAALLLAMLASPAFSQSAPARYGVPPTVSKEAAEALAAAYAVNAEQHKSGQVPRTPDEWIALAMTQAKRMETDSVRNAEASGMNVTEAKLGGVPVVRLRPHRYMPSKRVLLYLHGGGYTLFSAKGTLGIPSLMAKASGLEIVSVNYTLAPRGDWRQITGEVISVYQALLAEGHAAGSIGVFGDSAGGGLAAGAVLRMRDENVPLPGAVYLLSPWSDITATGDTYATLGHSDPVLDLRILDSAASAYAAPEDQRNPYVSPVYGDYSKPFPPTLLQAGTHEMFLSNAVRQYQAILGGGGEAVLDLYEGMPHVFPAMAPMAPETLTAISRAAAFFVRRLENPQ